MGLRKARMTVDKRDTKVLSLCHEYKEKKRCPECHSLETKKKGFTFSQIKTKRGLVKRKSQRFYCKSCGKSFTFKGYNRRSKVSDEIKRKAVLDFVTTKNSLSEVAERYEIGKTSILRWLPEIAGQFPSVEFTGMPSGLIALDGKEIKVKGKKRVVLAAIDAVSKELIYYEIFVNESTQSGYAFLNKVKAIYPGHIKGIVSDFGRGKCFIGLVERIFPNIPHQVCLVHFMRYVWIFLPKTRRSKFYWRNRVLKDMIRKIISASNREQSIYWLTKLKELRPFFRASYHKRFVRSIITNYSYLTRHYDYSYLPKETNRIENLNRQLERKLKNLDGFKSETNLYFFLKIWFTNYKLKTQKRPS